MCSIGKFKPICLLSLITNLDEFVQSLQTATIQCPYCWEEIDVLVDCSISCQQYIEDCSVCCRPITISVESSDGEVLSIEGRSEDE